MHMATRMPGDQQHGAAGICARRSALIRAPNITSRARGLTMARMLAVHPSERSSFGLITSARSSARRMAIGSYRAATTATPFGRARDRWQVRSHSETPTQRFNAVFVGLGGRHLHVGKGGHRLPRQCMAANTRRDLISLIISSPRIESAMMLHRLIALSAAQLSAVTSTTASAKACGASCGRLWPMPPLMFRCEYLPENILA